MSISMRRSNFLKIYDQPKLIHAILKKNIAHVKYIIANDDECVNNTDFERRTPLHLAAAIGSVEIVSILLNAGARVNARDSEWVSPLHRACRNNHDSVVKVLLEHNVDVNCRDRQYMTPMHVCAANNALECAKLILPHVNKIDASDKNSDTPLHHAVFNAHGHPNSSCDLSTFLLANGAEGNAFDKRDRRPIHYAASVDSADAIRFLVTNGKAEVNVHDKELMTPLHIASAKGCINALQVLLDYGANIDSPDVYGNTSMHWASLHGQDDIIDELIERGAQLNEKNHDGVTPLHYAAASSVGLGCLDTLLMHKNSIDLNVRDNYGRTALHLASKYGRITQICELIRCGANCNATDKNMETPLHYAAREGRNSVIEALIKQSPVKLDVNMLDSNGMTPLHHAAYGGFSDACNLLLENDANAQICDVSGRTPHYMATYSGNVECIKLLMPLPVKMTDAFNRSLLHYAAARNSVDCLEYILKEFPNKFNFNECDIFGRTPLHYALSFGALNENSVEYDDNQFVEMLLKNDARPEIPDNDGYYCLHYAALSGMPSALSLLIESYDWKTIELSKCPSHYAAYYGNEICLEILLRNKFQDIGPALKYAMLKSHHGCVTVIMDFLKENGASTIGVHRIIHTACQYGLHESLCHIIDNIPNVDIRDDNGRTPLMLAALSSSNSAPNCVELLLKHKADPNATDNQMRTPLFYAICSGVEDSVKHMLQYKANTRHRSLDGKTPFHIAAAMGNTDALYAMIMADDDTRFETLVDCQMLTAIHWAAYKNQMTCLTALLESSKLKTFFGSKITPLHLAAFEGNDQCVELLISHYGSEIVHLVNSKKRNALHYASMTMSKHTNIKLIDLLLSNDVNINCVDIYGRTPLMYTARIGNYKFTEKLINKGADATMEDCKRNTALHYACNNSHELIGLLILETNSHIVNHRNNEYRTPLHISASNGLTKITEKLLILGASVTEIDANGMTPSLCCAKNTDVALCLSLIESIMIEESKSRKSYCDRESASFNGDNNRISSESRQSIIKRKSAHTLSIADSFVTANSSFNSDLFNNINNDRNDHSSDSDFY